MTLGQLTGGLAIKSIAPQNITLSAWTEYVARTLVILKRAYSVTAFHSKCYMTLVLFTLLNHSEVLVSQFS